ncbi:MAG: LacI family DNA-binding transcriptional regulator [Bacillota bacterium]
MGDERVTINDIAKIAKVSPSTVSRVMANNPKISDATREKVFKVMKELNYHPNIIARSLANKTTRIAGVVIPGMAEKAFQHPFFPEVLRGISSMAHKHRYNILISSVDNPEEEKQTLKQFVHGGITEGIILLASRINDPSVSELIKTDFPFVVIGKPENENEVNWVDNNNFTAGYELVRHFISQGHRQIAFIGVTPGYIVTLDRLEGYKKALSDFGLSVDERLIVESKFSDDNGYDLIKQLLERGVNPTGVIACDDFLAFGALRFLSEQGLKVPENIAVAGFNNVPLSLYSHPSLTSVEINAFLLGSKAFELLLAAINSDFKSYNRAIVPAELVIRESTLKG